MSYGCPARFTFCCCSGHVGNTVVEGLSQLAHDQKRLNIRAINNFLFGS